jgi:hypothetical protein
MTRHGNVKEKRIPATGPFAPPKPSEADEGEAEEPMAVELDKHPPSDAFKPTTASKDAYRRVPGADASKQEMLPHDDEATRRAERPPGYSRVDEHGFRHLLDEDEDA